jgi:hypothetical protein
MSDPSAWLFERRGFVPSVTMRSPLLQYRDIVNLAPLYTREAIEAEIVAWLREEGKSDGEGSADEHLLTWAAQQVASGEYRGKSDG